jgi:hypothetical protein
MPKARHEGSHAPTPVTTARLRTNVFIERLWRSLKHEDIYLTACYADGYDAKAGISSWILFYTPTH